MFKLGINSNNECGKDINEVLTNTKNAGFKDVMLSFKTGAEENDIVTALNLGLNIPFVHLSSKYANNLWAIGESNDSYINILISQIELCGKYNIPIAVMHPTIGRPTDLVIDPNEQGLNSMLKILKVAEACNVKIALENMDKPNFKHFTYLMDNIDSKWLGFCYDAGHHNLYLPEVNLLEKYGDRLIAIHLHDNLMDWHPGYDFTRDLHMLPFDGKVDFENVCKNLANTMYNNTLMLEVHRIGLGEPRIYKEVEPEDFLNQAYKRATKLNQMITNYKNN